MGAQEGREMADAKPKSIYTIAAGSREIWEVEKSEDGTKVTIRYANKPERNIEIAGGAINDLIRVLQQLGPYY